MSDSNPRHQPPRQNDPLKGLTAEVVPVLRAQGDSGPTRIIDTHGRDQIVDDWVILRCTTCGKEGQTPRKDPPPKRTSPDGAYLGLCPQCAQSAGMDAPLNRARKRLRRRLRGR
jgi:hypothetical protein